MTAANNPDQPGARMPCETRKVFGFSVAVSSVEEMSSALAERALEAQAPCLVAAADAHVITLGVHDRGYGACWNGWTRFARTECLWCGS